MDIKGRRRTIPQVILTLDEEPKERTMPHVIVRLWPGKSEQQKSRLTEEIVKDVMNVLNYGEESVSVAIEEVKPQDWAEKVYEPDIVSNSEKPYKKLGYTIQKSMS
jgi:4-oxalocrotonate tautomerase